jgi:trehalose 2-sulfotransferase
MRPVTSYFICSTLRSGGGLLAGLLRSSGVAGRLEEYFWRDDVPSWRERWGAKNVQEHLDGVLREGTTSNGVFGARVMWAYLDDVVATIRKATDHDGARHAVLSAAFPRIRYVHLRRNDRVSQAVSWAKAEQTGVWSAGDDRLEPRSLTYNRGLIDERLAEIEEGESGWLSLFGEADVEPCEIVYEELAADPIQTTTSLIAFPTSMCATSISRPRPKDNSIRRMPRGSAGFGPNRLVSVPTARADGHRSRKIAVDGSRRACRFGP